MENKFEKTIITPNKPGFNTWSEKINGRIAMLGFIIILSFEALTKQKVLDLVTIFIK